MSQNLKHFLFLLSFVFVVAISSIAQQSSEPTLRDPDAAKSPATPSYIIQANDVLEIYVWKEPKLTRKVLVRPDGRISFPLVQDMQAAGMNPGDIKLEIEREL